MYSFFGKAFVSAPAAPPPTDGTPSSKDIKDAPVVSDDDEAPIPQKEMTEVEKRLQILRSQIARKRQSEEERIRLVRETQRKQAAYGRDIKQIRPKSAGYGTESEKIMGGGTGYHAQVFGLGDANKEVDEASLELQVATALVKQLAKEVKMGTAMKSELEEAITNLRRKAARTKSVSKQLSGFGEGKSNLSPLLILGAVGFAVWFLGSRT